MFVEIESQDQYLNYPVSDEVVVVSAPSWCVPCRQLHPHLVRLSEDRDVLYINLDNNPWATDAFGIKGVPAVFRARDYKLEVLRGRTYAQLTKELA